MSTVLVVDDEPGIRKSLGIILSRAGYKTSNAETVDQAIAIILAGGVDAIICDIVLPEKSGMELMQYVHDSYPEIPVIIISGEPTIKTTVQAMRLGAFDYFGKPVKGKILVEKVVQAVRKKQDHDRNKQALYDIEDRYRRLVNNLQDMVWCTDAEGIIKFVNPAVERILGYNTADSIGFPPDQYMTLQSIERVKGWVRKALKTKPIETNIRGNVEYIHKDGHIVACEMNVTMVLNRKSRLIALEGITRELT